jgi:arsenate reductase (glutaredoxin)
MSEKIKIYHNPRCRKSREVFHLLTEKSIDFDTVLYLNQPPSKDTVSWLFNTYLGNPEDLIRKNETLWKENFKGKSMTKEAIIESVTKHPILLERPLLVTEDSVILGRPLENISSFLQRNTY